MAEALDYPYELAAAYWPGLDRPTFEALADGLAIVTQEWNETFGADPNPPRHAVETFYRETYGTLLYLMRELVPLGAYGSLEDRANIVRHYMEYAPKGLGAQSVLDYGGGVGGTALQLARWGYTVGLFEVGPVLEFARWYLGRQGRSAEGPRPGQVCCYGHFPVYDYDAICAIDVLEHCYDPVALLQRFWDKLPAGGLVILTRHSFKEHPTHLMRTFWLFEALDRVLSGIGFRPKCAPDPHYGIGAWEKVPT